MKPYRFSVWALLLLAAAACQKNGGGMPGGIGSNRMRATQMAAQVTHGRRRLATGSEVSVPVETSGIISLTSALPPIYNGRYVLQTTDFGFLWLDTELLRAGLVQAEAKCGVGQPPSNSGIYVTGDCNGTSTISSSGDLVLVRQFNSQCGAATKGCDGPAIRGPARLSFQLGTWAYLGDRGNLADSTQTADPYGNTWTCIRAPDDTAQRHFLWIASGTGPTPPPTSTPPPGSATPTSPPSTTPPSLPTPTVTPCLEGSLIRIGFTCAECRNGQWEIVACPSPTPTHSLTTSTPTNPVPSPTATATPAPTHVLRLGPGGRFAVSVRWRTLDGQQGDGHAAPPMTPLSGYFYFFSPDNPELAIKILDGTSLNGYFWLFYAGLSNLQYVITATDLATGRTKMYSSPQGTFTSSADLQFAGPASLGMKLGTAAVAKSRWTPAAAPADIARDAHQFNRVMDVATTLMALMAVIVLVLVFGRRK